MGCPLIAVLYMMLLPHTIIRVPKFVSYSSVNITYLLTYLLTYLPTYLLTYLPNVIWTIKLEILYLL